MGVTIFRPGQSLVIPGVTVMQPRPSAAAAGWWEVSGQTCIAAYQPKGAASLAASYVNLTGNATYNAAPGVAPTLDADGWVFVSASTQYLATGIVPASGWSMIARFSGISNPDAMVIGSSSNSSTRLYLRSHTSGMIYASGGGDITTTPRPASGVFALAGQQGYRNGSADGAAISPGWTGVSTHALTIAAYNVAGTISTFLNGKIQAVAIYSTTLSAGDVATLTTAINAL